MLEKAYHDNSRIISWKGVPARDAYRLYFDSSSCKAFLSDNVTSAIRIENADCAAKIWSDVAKALTLRAAESAGFGSEENPVQLMSEPDAAAAWTLLRDVKPNNLKVGCNYYPTIVIANTRALYKAA